MKKNIVLYPLVLLVGIVVGYYSAVIPERQQAVLRNEREKQFHIRTEEFQPSCTQLQNTKIPSIIQKGSDYFLVITRTNDFMVFGLNVDENNPPMTFWWGAELEGALRQACN